MKENKQKTHIAQYLDAQHTHKSRKIVEVNFTNFQE